MATKKQMALRLDESLVSILKEEAKKANRSLSNYVECILMNSVYNEQENEISEISSEDSYQVVAADKRKHSVNERTNIESKKILSPMSIHELNRRVEKSENDFKTGRFKTSSELIGKYK